MLLQIHKTVFIIIVVIITSSSIIGKTALVEPLPSLEDTRFYPVFTSSDFVVFFYRTYSSFSRPTPNLEDQVPAFMSPRDKMASYTPRNKVLFSLSSTPRRAAVEIS
jgi:hypothetical protein